eukprot:4638713-Prymnesium_polylepis.1
MHGGRRRARRRRCLLSREKTRSAAAEFGVNDKTIRAASAHVGNLVPLLAHQPSTPSVNAFVSWWSTVNPLAAER